MLLQNIPKNLVRHLLISALFISLIGGGLTSCSTSKKATKDQTETEQRGRRHRDRNESEGRRNHHEDLSKYLKGDEKKVIGEAETWIGTPYVYARHDKGVATDCSGFTMMVFQVALDLKIPRNSAKQAEFCNEIKHKNVKPGDLVFFATGKDPRRVSHVGIMIDDTNFLHASSSKGVILSSLESNYYSKRFLKFGRVPGMNH